MLTEPAVECRTRQPRLPPLMRLLLMTLTLSAFLSGIKFLPGLRNNFGPFEVVFLILLAVFVALRLVHPVPIRLHPLVHIIGLMTLLGVLSLPKTPAHRQVFAMLQVLILLFMLCFCLVLYNLILRYQLDPGQLLRWVTLSVLIVGPWILISGIASPSDLMEVGPFRNRAHMGNYMLSAFWLVLIGLLWPGLRRRDRLLGAAALTLVLYAVASSGRRSAYLALLVGLFGICVGWLAASRASRTRLLGASILSVGVLAVLYFVGSRRLPELAFFRQRVATIDDRVGTVFASGDSWADRNFFALQRRGVLRAVYDSPLFGIGWGGFADSKYSPTRHEVHSTPLRFLAEMGLIGLALYCAMMGYLLFGAVRIFRLARGTPHQAAAYVLCVALWSLATSYLYNRHITERTFWLLLVVFLAIEAFIGADRRSRARPRGRPAGLGGDRRSPYLLPSGKSGFYRYPQ